MILAVNSSPVKEGNLESMVKCIAEGTGRLHRMVRLPDLEIRPCLGCLKCAKNGRCIHEDGMSELYPYLEETEALIMGGVNFNGRLNASGHLFLERLYPLYHHEPAFRGKPAAIAAIGGEDPDPAMGDMSAYLEDVYFFDLIGSVTFRSGIFPCFFCGFGMECPVGMPALHWKPEELSSFQECRKRSIVRFDEDSERIEVCYRLGRSLGEAAGQG